MKTVILIAITVIGLDVSAAGIAAPRSAQSTSTYSQQQSNWLGGGD